MATPTTTPTKTRISTKPKTTDFHEIYYVITSKLWLILICILLWVAAGITFILYTPKIYEATTTVQVDEADQNVVNMQQVDGENYQQDEALKTIEGNLQRVSLLVRVLKRPEFKDAKDPLVANIVANLDHLDEPQINSELLGLTGVIKALLRHDTRLIDISVDTTDPFTSQSMANALVEEYINEVLEVKTGMNGSANVFLDEQAQKLQSKLADTEKELELFKGLDDLRQRISDQEKLIDDLNQRYLAQHPRLIEAKALLTTLEAQYMKELKEKDPTVTADPQSDDEFRKVLSDQESHFDVLQRDLASDQEIYATIIQRQKETDITKKVDTVSIRQVERAPLPVNPVWPRKFLTLLVCTGLGGLTGLCLAFFFNSLDSSFHRADDAESFLKLPLLGAVPKFISSDKKGESPAAKSQNQPVGKKVDRQIMIDLILHYYPSSLAAESFRSLRAALKLIGRQSERKTFLFTSALPAEGKSFTCSNYAVSLAQEGNRVLLIDADLRRPTVHRIFQLQSLAPGLTEFLSQQNPLSDLIRETYIPNLYLLSAGSMAPSPAELLSSGGFKELLEEAVLTFDKVVVDSAPIQAVSDTLLISELFQTVCIVIRSGKTPRAIVRKSIMSLRMAGAHLSGMILNFLPRRSGLGYDPYYYYYQSTERYGEAYGTKERKEQGASSS